MNDRCSSSRSYGWVTSHNSHTSNLASLVHNLPSPFWVLRQQKRSNLILGFLRACDKCNFFFLSLRPIGFVRHTPSSAFCVARSSHSRDVSPEEPSRGVVSWAECPLTSSVPISPSITFSLAGKKRKSVHIRCFLLQSMVWQQGPHKKMQGCGRKKPFSSEHTQ